MAKQYISVGTAAWERIKKNFEDLDRIQYTVYDRVGTPGPPVNLKINGFRVIVSHSLAPDQILIVSDLPTICNWHSSITDLAYKVAAIKGASPYGSTSA